MRDRYLKESRRVIFCCILTLVGLGGLFASSQDIFATVPNMPAKPKSPDRAKNDEDLTLSISGKVQFDSFEGKNDNTWQYKFVYTPPKQGVYTLEEWNQAIALPAVQSAGYEVLDNYNVGGKEYVLGALPGYVVGKGKPTKVEETFFSLDRSRVTFKAEGKRNGVSYGLIVSLTGNMGTSRSVKEAYIAVEHVTGGGFYAGNTTGMEDRIGVAPMDFLAGGGGTDGNWTRFVNFTTGLFPFMSMVGDTAWATKVGYVTPRIFGFACGVSFTPNTQHLGEMVMKTGSPYSEDILPYDRQSVCTGINYLAEGQGSYIQASAVMLRGRTYPEIYGKTALERYHTKSYDFGLNVGVGPVELGAELILSGRSGMMRLDGSAQPALSKSDVPGVTELPLKHYNAGSAGKHYLFNLGAAVAFGSSKVSLAYLKESLNTGFITSGKSGKATAKAWVFSAQYTIAPGFVPFVEAALYRMKNPDWAYMCSYRLQAAADGDLNKMNGTGNNEAKVFLTGLKVQF